MDTLAGKILAALGYKTPDDPLEVWVDNSEEEGTEEEIEEGGTDK